MHLIWRLLDNKNLINRCLALKLVFIKLFSTWITATHRSTRWGRRARPGSSPGWRTRPPPWASARSGWSAPPWAARWGWAPWRRWPPRARTPPRTAPARCTWGCHLGRFWRRGKRGGGGGGGPESVHGSVDDVPFRSDPQPAGRCIEDQGVCRWFNNII